MGRKLVVGGKLDPENIRDRFVWWAFNHDNLRTRCGLGLGPFEISWHDRPDGIGAGWVLRPCDSRAESSKRESERRQSDE